MKYFFILLLITSCASRPAKDPQGKKTVSMESKQLANEQETTFVSEFTFPKKGTKVSSFAKNDMKAKLTEAKKKGPIKTAKIISWADLEYPSVHTKELSGDQKKLATNRNENIEKYLKSLDNSLEVETISMAERPGTFKRLISSDDAEIKKSLEKSGLPNTDTTVKVPGKASKAVVMFILDR